MHKYRIWRPDEKPKQTKQDVICRQQGLKAAIHLIIKTEIVQAYSETQFQAFHIPYLAASHVHSYPFRCDSPRSTQILYSPWPLSAFVFWNAAGAKIEIEEKENKEENERKTTYKSISRRPALLTQNLTLRGKVRVALDKASNIIVIYEWFRRKSWKDFSIEWKCGKQHWHPIPYNTMILPQCEIGIALSLLNHSYMKVHRHTLLRLHNLNWYVVKSGILEWAEGCLI